MPFLMIFAAASALTAAFCGILASFAFNFSMGAIPVTIFASAAIAGATSYACNTLVAGVLYQNGFRSSGPTMASWAVFHAAVVMGTTITLVHFLLQITGFAAAVI
jgi:hypothetical protein